MNAEERETQVNYIRNLLRRLWPFVTRRELMEVRKELIAFDGQDFKILIREIDELRTLLATANRDIETLATWLDETPKKKPSRKKPAKKGKKK